MEKPNQLNSKGIFVRSSSQDEDHTGRWEFIKFDSEYRPVLVNTVTHQIKVLDRYTILWDEHHNPTYIPL